MSMQNTNILTKTKKIPSTPKPQTQNSTSVMAYRLDTNAVHLSLTKAKFVYNLICVG